MLGVFLYCSPPSPLLPAPPFFFVNVLFIVYLCSSECLEICCEDQTGLELAGVRCILFCKPDLNACEQKGRPPEGCSGGWGARDRDSVQGGLSVQQRPLNFVLWTPKTTENRFSFAVLGMDSWLCVREAGLYPSSKETMNKMKAVKQHVSIWPRMNPEGGDEGGASGKACHCLSCQVGHDPSWSFTDLRAILLTS